MSTTVDMIERRFMAGIELRTEGGKPPKIVGYAAVFDKISEPLYEMRYREKIAKGAFKNSLAKSPDVRALVDHEPGRILGRTKAGTLAVREDDAGLFVEINPPDTTVGRDTMESIRRGDVSGMSFAFRTIDDAWETRDGEELRTLKEIELVDVAVVTYPAYPDTSVAVRSLAEWKKAQAPAPENNSDLDLYKRKQRILESA